MWKTKKNKVACWVTVLTLGLSLSAHAEDLSGELNRGRVTQLQEGQLAPFKGVLLSQPAAATLFGDLKFSQQECQLKLDEELRMNTANFRNQLDILALRLKIEEDKSAAMMKIKNERIGFLEKNYAPTPWYESGEFWLATGVTTGIVVTVAAGYALGQVPR